MPPGPTSGPSMGKAWALEYVFTATMVRSAGPIDDGSPSARTRSVKSPIAL